MGADILYMKDSKAHLDAKRSGKKSILIGVIMEDLTLREILDQRRRAIGPYCLTMREPEHWFFLNRDYKRLGVRGIKSSIYHNPDLLDYEITNHDELPSIHLPADELRKAGAEESITNKTRFYLYNDASLPRFDRTRNRAAVEYCKKLRLLQEYTGVDFSSLIMTIPDAMPFRYAKGHVQNHRHEYVAVREEDYESVREAIRESLKTTIQR